MVIIVTQTSSHIFCCCWGKKKALHLTSFTYGIPDILKYAKFQKSKVNMRANEMTGLKYPFPAYGFFQERNEKTWRNINDPYFFPTCEAFCNCEILPGQELCLGSFIPLFAQDWLWGRGFREGWSRCRDHVRAAASITWRDKRKDLEGQCLKKQAHWSAGHPHHVPAHDGFSFPIEGQMEIALAQKEGLCGLRIWSPGQWPGENSIHL